MDSEWILNQFVFYTENNLHTLGKQQYLVVSNIIYPGYCRWSVCGDTLRPVPTALAQAGTPAPWKGRSSSQVSLLPAWISTSWKCMEGGGSYQMPPLTVDWFIQNAVLTPGWAEGHQADWAWLVGWLEGVGAGEEAGHSGTEYIPWRKVDVGEHCSRGLGVGREHQKDIGLLQGSDRRWEVGRVGPREGGCGKGHTRYKQKSGGCLWAMGHCATERFCGAFQGSEHIDLTGLCLIPMWFGEDEWKK